MSRLLRPNRFILTFLFGLAACGGGEDAGSGAKGKQGPLRITTTEGFSADQGQAFEAEITATGGAPDASGYRWTLYTGELPAGVYLSSQGTSAFLSGVPKDNGRFDFEVRAADPAGASATQALTLEVKAAPGALSLVTPQLPPGEAEAEYSGQLKASGGNGPYRWTVTEGALPPGLSLQASGNPSRIFGTPHAFGRFAFTVRLTDADGATAAKVFDLEIADNRKPLAIVTTVAQVPDGVVEQDYRVQITAAEGSGQGYQWEAQGLPEGLTLTGGTPSAVLAGVVREAGSYHIQVKVTDSEGGTATQAYDLIWSPAPAPLRITTYSLPPAALNQTYTATISAMNGTASGYRWAVVDGALPEGLSLTPEATPTATLSGTPTQVGVYPFALQVTDAAGATNQVSYELVVSVPEGPLSLAAQPLPNPAIGEYYEASVLALGGREVLSWYVSSGSLPPGLQLQRQGRPTTTISGYPIAQTGSWDFELTVYDADNHHVSQSFNLTITDDHSTALSISTTTLPPPACLPIAIPIQTEGGDKWNYTWSATDLPDGLELVADGLNASLVGSPRGDGPHSFTVQVEDSSGRVATQAYTLNINTVNQRWLVAAGYVSHRYRLRMAAVDVCGPTPGPMRTLLTTAIPEATLESDSVQVLPDGRHVVFIADLEVDNRKDAYVLDLGTAAATPVRINTRTAVEEGDVISLLPSPDGRKLAYRGDLVVNTQDEVFVADLSDPAHIPTPHRLTPAVPDGGDSIPDSMVWSADSQHLAFTGDLRTDGTNELYLADLSGPTPTVQAVSGVAHPDAVSRWSPTSSHLYFTAEADTGTPRRQLWRVAPGAVLAAPELVSGATLGPAVLRGDTAERNLKTWDVSPTGDHAFFTVDGAGDSIQLYLVNLSDLEVRNVPATNAEAKVRYGAWSPDGAHLAVAGDFNTEDQIELALLNPAAAAPSYRTVSGTMIARGDVITYHRDNLTRLRWSPDASKVAFIADKIIDGQDRLFIADIHQTGEPLDVLGTALEDDVLYFTWSPNSRMIAGLGDLFHTYYSDPFVVSADGQNLVRHNASSVYITDRRVSFSQQSDWVYLGLGLSGSYKSIYRLNVSDLAATAAQAPLQLELVATTNTTRSMGDIYMATP